MGKTLEKVTVSLTAMLMLFGSTYTSVYSASATGDEIQPKTWYVYGDVNNDGEINGLDVSSVIEAIITFENLTGDSRLPLNYAVARPEVYFGKGNYVPQAADINEDGYITSDDVRLISLKQGRCGQPFFIN